MARTECGSGGDGLTAPRLEACSQARSQARHPILEQCRKPEAPWAELATGNHDRLGARRNGKHVLGRPRSSTVMPEEPAASPDHAGDVLGEVLRFESRMEQPPQPEGLPVTGGGALLDLDSHAVDQALHPLGPVRSVYAELRLAPEEDGSTRGSSWPFGTAAG